MNHKTTIKDIAKALNTTPATVSRALNDNPRISEKTRRSVKDTARKLGFKLNPVASALRSGRSKTIGVIVPYIDRSFFSSVIRGIEEEVKKHGYSIMICQSSEDFASEQESIQILMNARVAGIAMSLAGAEEGHLTDVINANIPIVTFDRIADGLDQHAVAADDFEGSYKATRHLIEQGYRRIAHLSGDQSINIYRNRLRGYRAAIEENGLEFTSDLIVPTASDIKEGRTATAALLGLYNPPDAISCASDFSALGALQYCKSIGVNVPDELGIVGFANEEFTEYVEPGITSVNQKSLEMGKMVGQVFFDPNADINSEKKKILLKPELIIRDSSLRKKN